MEKNPTSNPIANNNKITMESNGVVSIFEIVSKSGLYKPIINNSIEPLIPGITNATEAKIPEINNRGYIYQAIFKFKTISFPKGIKHKPIQRQKANSEHKISILCNPVL